MRKILFAALTAIVALSNLGYAAAQTGPTGPTGSPAPSGPSAPPAAAVNGISEMDLLNYLRTLDANVKMEKSQDGKKTCFEVNLNRDGWRFQLRLILSERGLEIYSPLTTIANVQSVPASALGQLLQANWKMSPSFYLVPQNDGRVMLILHYGLSRSAVTTASLGNVINQFCNDLRQTYPAWSAVVNAGK